MSTELQTAPDTTATAVADCDVCGHPDDIHDVIARRYCLATMHGAISRSCICAVG